jgi:uncharacterized protein YdeI (YjbR/CyaY-like superfamily)
MATWLDKNGERETEIWLVFYKKSAGVAGLPYEATVEDALCFGWIDSIVKRLDEERYARKFTPRKPGSRWSEVNKRRAEKMIESGQMTARGMALVDRAKGSGEWDQKRTRPDISVNDIPVKLELAFADHPDAEENFLSLAPTYRGHYITWIGSAKREDTRKRRTAEAIQMLKRGEKLGLK